MYRYQLVKFLGSGSFGCVQKAQQKIDGKVVAIKMVDISQVKPIDAENEVSTLIQLDNENIVKYFESFTHDKYFCIVMKFCEGITLKQFIQEQRNPLPESDILHIFFQMANALKYCHKKNILHRDLKPENIILGPNNKIKLLDFGVAKIMDSSTSYASTYAGTPKYMSPEILQGEKYSYSSDVWSMGVIVYELMTVQLPFTISKFDERPLSITRNYSPILIKIMNNMLEKDQYVRILLKTILKHPTLWNAEKNDFDDNIEQLKKIINEKNKEIQEVKQKNQEFERTIVQLENYLNESKNTNMQLKNEYQREEQKIKKEFQRKERKMKKEFQQKIEKLSVSDQKEENIQTPAKLTSRGKGKNADATEEDKSEKKESPTKPNKSSAQTSAKLTPRGKGTNKDVAEKGKPKKSPTKRRKNKKSSDSEYKINQENDEEEEDDYVIINHRKIK
jgi:NIMA (never in mitosis gene a)-related kinase